MGRLYYCEYLSPDDLAYRLHGPIAPLAHARSIARSLVADFCTSENPRNLDGNPHLGCSPNLAIHSSDAQATSNRLGVVEPPRVKGLDLLGRSPLVLGFQP